MMKKVHIASTNDENLDDLVILDLVPSQSPYSKQQDEVIIPPVDLLFKEVQYENQALKELQQKNSSSDIYQKIKKALQKKLGYGKLMRGMSAKETVKIREMIHTCNQRKHLRTAPATSRDRFKSQRTLTDRKRNLSAKQFQMSGSFISKQISRPLTSRSARTSQTYRTQTSNQLLKTQGFNLEIPNLQKITQQPKLKKKAHGRQFSDMLYQKQNILKKQEQQTKRNICKSQLQSEQNSILKVSQNTKHYRKKQNKQVLKMHFNNLLDSCNTEKKQINNLNKKIGYLQYYCQKMTQRQSKIYKFCKKMDDINKINDDYYNI